MAAKVGLQIGAATECTFDLNQQRTTPWMRRREGAQFELSRSDEHGLTRARGMCVPDRIGVLRERACPHVRHARDAHNLRSTANVASMRSGSAR